MMYENDKYEVPEYILKMSKEEIEEALAKEREKMKANPQKKPKPKLSRPIKFNWN